MKHDVCAFGISKASQAPLCSDGDEAKVHLDKYKLSSPNDPVAALSAKSFDFHATIAKKEDSTYDSLYKITQLHPGA